MSSEELMKLADVSMYDSAAMPREEGGRVKPKVYLVSATPDPLGAIACAQRLFAGKPTYDLASVTDKERRWAWEESQKSHLKAPLEMVDLQFFIEGVTRAFTHQMVRQRTAVYAQESLRFAVKGDLVGEVAIPPSLASLPEDHPLVDAYLKAVQEAEEAYERLIAAGIPAEDARALLPHCTTTRLFYKTNLRNLLDTIGNRLCTQAQFEWRVVAVEMMRAIHDYRPPLPDTGGSIRSYRPEGLDGPEYYRASDFKSTAWQFELIATARPSTFAPVCYQMGRCPFRGDLDRHCKIRERVNQNEDVGRKPELWHILGGEVEAIQPEEWLLDHTSARRQRDINEEHSHDLEAPCFPACPMWGVSGA